MKIYANRMCDCLSTLFSLSFCSCFFFAVKHVEGPDLVLQRLTRADMGPYYCIAKNGVPSPVSKRIMVNVHCKYIKVSI